MTPPTVEELAERLRRVLDSEIGKLEAAPPTGDDAVRARIGRDLADAIRLLREPTPPKKPPWWPTGGDDGGKP